MLKKWTIAISSRTSLQSICNLAPHSTSSCLPRRTRAKRKPLTQPLVHQCRAYPMVAGDYGRHRHEILPWPEVTGKNAIPTPYQIFNQKKGSRYSKRRFYELVKMYHPDRHNLDDLLDELPFKVKLERYRLVVAANELLSNPAKRAAYDCYGAGWNGQPEVVRQDAWTENDRDSGREGPFKNATWEDWEKWHNRDDKSKQKPVFFSNGTFVAFVVMVSALGAVFQATRADNISMSLIEQRDAVHTKTSKDLMRRRNESTNVGDRDARVTTFLRERDPFGSGVTNPLEEGYRKLLPASDICSSSDIHARSIDANEPNDKPSD